MMRQRERDQISTGWKDITLKIYGSEESVVIPVMVSAKVLDLKRLVAESHGDVDPSRLDFLFKCGPSWKKQRNGDEVQSKIVVKGIKSFKRGAYEWLHPFMIIGAGSMGLRAGLEFTRQKANYVLMERNHDVGGNAWLLIANPTSKLQTEGPQYQMQYDIYDGNVNGLMEGEQYGFWPSRKEILDHERDTAKKWGMWDSIRFSTEVTEMVIQQEPHRPKSDFNARNYDYVWRSTKEGSNETGITRISNLLFMPGCLVVPHRNKWPGEELFEGSVGYGFSREFDYAKVDRENVLLIGMGAFSHENVRTLVEHGANRVWNVARHFNLLMPRLVCWWVNQSSFCPPTAAMVLHAMKNMYDLLGWDAWTFFSVTANPERTAAAIKQYTRWGISDIYFLALYYKKAIIIEAQVKRFKPSSAVLTNGQVLDDVHHIVKVIGFDADFGVDRLNQCNQHIGYWPNGDCRRWVMSDNSAIDASRFTNIALSPAACGLSHMVLFFFNNPTEAPKVLDTGLMPVILSEPEVGSPCYHFIPRVAVQVGMTLGMFGPTPEADYLNSEMKKRSMWWLADAKGYQFACQQDWYSYCRLFKDQGCDLPYPRYPYTEADLLGLCEDEEELRKREAAQREAKFESKVHEQLEETVPEEGSSQLLPADATGMDPGSPLTYEPARRVLQARNRSRSPVNDGAERQRWLDEGRGVKEWLLKNKR